MISFDKKKQERCSLFCCQIFTKFILLNQISLAIVRSDIEMYRYRDAPRKATANTNVGCFLKLKPKKTVI